MLELRDLNKTYGSVTALDGCSFEIKRGSLVGFLGPNGAGKTTAMRSVFGLVTPDSGSVSWDGRPITASERLRFGYMPEQRGLYPRMQIAQQLVYFGRLHGLGKAEASRLTAELLDELGLADRAKDRLEELSHGNQQRVQLATALLHNPELLVLDEPFGGLDPIGVASLSGLLQARAASGAAVVFSSHQLDVVEGLCEEVVVINRGAVALEGNVRDLRSSSQKRYLEVGMRGAESGWHTSLPGSPLVVSDHHVRSVVDADVDLPTVLAAVNELGTITDFSFEPPTLSEVFREVVNR